MAKFYGKVGYVRTVETSPGVFTSQTTEVYYYGDILYSRNQWQSRDKINDDLHTSEQISILADEFAYKNFSIIKYVEWMGALWKVEWAEVRRPRINLTLGGLYNNGD